VLVSSTSPCPLTGSPGISEELEKKMVLPSEVRGAKPEALAAEGDTVEAAPPTEIWYACGVQGAVAPKQVS